MYLCYDEAVKIGIKAYHALKYADSGSSAFRVASREFKEYMENINLPYSLELSGQWINESKKNWKAHKLKSSRKTISVLQDIMEHGCVTTSLQNKVERTSPYAQLPNSSKIILENYLASLNVTFGTAYLTQIRNACSRFFLFLKSLQISQSTEISHEVIKSFFARNIHISSKQKARSDNQIKYFLIYMAHQGLIQENIELTLNKFAVSDLIIVKELPEAERSKFRRFFGASENEISSSREKYAMAAKQLSDTHKSKEYSATIRKSALQAIRYFRAFMDVNAFAYSHELALEWLKYQRIKWSKVKYLTFRRVLLCINEILSTGTLSTCRFSTYRPKYLLSEWGKNLLALYLKEREYEACAASTLAMTRSACSRFIVFLDKQGVVNEKGITPLVIKTFQAQDNHSTVEGKNAYAIKIRDFVRFLARIGLVPNTLELAISTEMAPHTSIVTTLSNEQIEAIYTFRKNANHPMELRNTAIIMLGLKMGLRKSDIVNLKLTDISWKDNLISFVQQKTGVHLKLPFPIDVGNSLYRYINEGRPNSNSLYVFIHHRAPYMRFGKASFTRLLQAAVASYPDSESICGFHITRKTFASKLLSTGNPVTTIAAALGHVSMDTVNEYLATNEDKMRLCAIGIKGIGYCGGLSL